MRPVVPAPRQIFDPGIDDSAMLLDSLFTTLSTVYGVRPASLREGEFSVNNDIAKMFNVLFDSGALHHSYISAEIVEGHRDQWESCIRPYETWVKLADQSTIIKTKEIVRGVLSFVSDGGDAYSGEVDAIVWSMQGLDFILGLPDIVRNFITLFFLMLKQYQMEMLGAVSETAMLPGETRLWSDEVDQEAPEEAECPMPVAFGPVLNFMETSYEVARDEYFQMLDEHIGDNLRDCKALSDILTSDLAVDRFVTREWDGISGFPPLKLRWKETFPESHPVRSRPINPRLYENAKKEYERLCEYMYVKSTSPYASPLVVASKNTKPFIRFCGDYTWLNPHLIMPQEYIPRVQYEIEKMSNFKIYMDIDLTNAFHQWPLDPETSERLAIQTPWGLVQPKFMPEGISPASGYLQSCMRQMFASIEDFSVVIFDNVLLGAHDHTDACEKLKRFLEICREHNVILKMSKSWFGFKSVKFFGYQISQGKYEMDADRKKSIMEFEMPTNQKSMQRFLGAAFFFKSFVANYSDVAATLHKMTHKDFNWDKRTWTEDYVKAFEHMKQALVTSIALFFPDYSLTWILRVDASDVAAGAVLFQVRIRDDGTEVYEPIGFASKKFSDTAFKWDPYKKEAYACFFGVHYFSYYLRGKAFILETDHRNLVWIEKSEVPMVVRWRVFLQSFKLYLRHIPGTKNLVADWLSRMVASLFGISLEEYLARGIESADVSCLLSVLIRLDVAIEHPIEELCKIADTPIAPIADYVEQEGMFRPKEFTPDYVDAKEFPGSDNLATEDISTPVRTSEVLPISELVEQHVPFAADVPATFPAPTVTEPQGRGKDAVVVRTVTWTADEMFKEVHGGRKMHWGARRTWLGLNKRFPGHKIPYRWIQMKVEECTQCQIFRDAFRTYIEKINTHLKPPHPRARVGFDGLSITPPDKDGNTHLVVIVDFYKKYVWAHVAKDYSAKEVATALFIYYCMFGVFDEVWTDSGSNILNDTVRQLNEWLQIKHVVALVDRHETCGVEGSNKQIVRHLSTLVHDLRVRDRWSDPIILCLVLFVINDQINSETGVRPLDAMFGSADGPYLRLPTDALPADITNAWVVALDADLKRIRQISSEYQRQLVEERTRATPPEQQNTYQPGDIVIWARDKSKPRPHKLDAHYTGPWEVIQQTRNVVVCQHLADPSRRVPLFVDRLNLHLGTREAALEAARRDLDQYVVTAVKAWKGNPKARKEMKFWVEYEDGDAMWVSWKADLVACEQYQDFIHSHPELFLLLLLQLCGINP